MPTYVDCLWRATYNGGPTGTWIARTEHAMSRERSIPDNLEHVVYTLWSEGQSPNEIVQWLENTNPQREHPVHTSRASVIRLLDRYEKQSNRGLILTIQRFRAQSPAMAERLDEFLGIYLNNITNAKDIERTEGDAKWRKSRLRHMKEATNLITRKLRLAGVTGRAGRDLMERHEAELATAMKEIEELELIESSEKNECPDESVRSNGAIASPTSEIQTDIPPPQPMTELPVMTVPSGEWSVSDKSWWGDEVARVNDEMRQAWLAGARDLIPFEDAHPLPPTSEAPGDRGIPLLTLRDGMRMSLEQQLEIEAWMKRVNPWLLWLRNKINADHQAALDRAAGSAA